MPQILINLDQYLELEKISSGAFAPLLGFMTESEFYSVIDTMRLPSGDLFSIPIFLDISKSDADKIQGKSKVDVVQKVAMNKTQARPGTKTSRQSDNTNAGTSKRLYPPLTGGARNHHLLKVLFCSIKK